MTVHIDDHAGTAVLTLDRPPLNALDPDTLDAVLAALQTLSAAPPAAGAVLTGRGRAFTAGVDIRVVANADAATRGRLIIAINRLAAALYALPFPVVAAFNGHSIGAGIVMGLASDRRIAARGDGRFVLTEVTAGIPYPAAALEVVRAGLAEPHLSRLVLGGETLDADGALATGMIDAIVAPDALLESALESARTLSKAAAFTAVKAQLRAPVRARIEAIIASGGDPLLATAAG
jgi:enoyl-CoA hydratase